MSVQNLVYIGKVIEINAIQNADKIEQLICICGKGGKWCGVSKKGEFKEGELCLVYLQDSIVPQTPEFEFMAKYNYRVRMQRLRGVPSECLIQKLSFDGILGEDVTERVGVTKYEKPIPPNLSGQILGYFPQFIPKTDEPNFQRVDHIVNWLIGKRFYSTIKYDGTSGTIYHHKGHFGACTRNLELKPDNNVVIWKLSKKYNLQNNLPDGIAIQFEIIGPKIQKNSLKLTEIDLRAFNAYDINKHCYLDAEAAYQLFADLNIPGCEYIHWDDVFTTDYANNLQKLAEGKYSSGVEREGLVFRSMKEATIQGDRSSFKVINLKYKD